MSKGHAFKNNSNQLVLIPKATSTTSTDTVPLSIQFQKIQEATRQQVLHQNVSHTSQFLQNTELVDDTTLPIDPATSALQKKSPYVQLPLINDVKEEIDCNIVSKEDIVIDNTIHTTGIIINYKAKVQSHN